MSQENVEIVRKLIEAWNAGGVRHRANPALARVRSAGLSSLG